MTLPWPIRSVLAGTAGTAALTLTYAAERRLRPRHRGPLDYDDSLVPGQIVASIMQLPHATARETWQLGTALRWGYGSAFGLAHGLLRHHVREPRASAIFGGTLISATFSLFPLLGHTPPPWRWRADVLATCLATHATYVLVVAAVDNTRGPTSAGDGDFPQPISSTTDDISSATARIEPYRSPTRSQSMSVTTESPRDTIAPGDTLVESSFSAVVNAPLENVDIPAWCFSLPEGEYQECSPAHYSAAVTTAPDGRRISINVEMIGGSLMVQHYLEEVSQPDHLRLVSNSDVFTPTGRTKIGVTWDLRVERVDESSCEFTNTTRSTATPELIELLTKQGIPVEVFAATRKPNSVAHNRQETPMFAKSIERYASHRSSNR